jgi:iron uptake system component EfeO
MGRIARLQWLLAVAAVGPFGCSSADDSGKTDAEYRAEVTTGMHDSLALEIADWKKAATELMNAAPTPSGRGWDATQDAQAIADMKEVWKRTRVAYEHIEGAIAPLFPEIDFATDARYDDYLGELGDKGDADPFDGEGVTGQHAIERILYADSIPSYVVAFESKLPGYAAARFPKTEAEASDFKNKLCAKLVSDIASLEADWKPAKIDLEGAYQGLVALMNEQGEKVNKAATQEEESRYAQRTLADLHANLDGTVKIYNLFQPWIVSKSGSDPAKSGSTVDKNIQAGFTGLRTVYGQTPGDAIPQPPAGWSSIDPKPADLESDFGKLFVAVQEAVDPAKDGSIVQQMNNAARLLGYDVFTPEP